MKKPDMQAPYIKALLYGQPGATKTRTAASATFDPDLSPVLILESAGNPLSIRSYDPLPTILSMERLTDYNTIYDYLIHRQPYDHPFRKMCEDAQIPLPERFNTVIVDGATQIQHFAFDVIVPGTDVPPGDIPASYEYPHYQRVLNTFSNFAEKFLRNLDMHVIITALEDEHQEKNGTTKVRPLIWGQSRGELCAYAYLVARLAPVNAMDRWSKTALAEDLKEVKGSETVAFFRQTESFYAKDQYGMRDNDGALLRYMVDPNMTKIWETILDIEKWKETV